MEGHYRGKSRNGYSGKTLKGDHGEVDTDVPRDRNGSFEPHIVRKGQTRLTEFDTQILTLYAKGMTTRNIVDTFKEMYGAEVSTSLVSRVTKLSWIEFMICNLVCLMRSTRLFAWTAW